VPGLRASGARIVRAARGPIVRACDHQIGLEQADPTDRAVDLSAPAQADRVLAGLTGPAQGHPRDQVDQTVRERADPSGRAIVRKVPASAGPNGPPRALNARQNVPARVPNARQNGPPLVRNGQLQAGRQTIGDGRPARNNGATRDHSNDPARSRRTGRLNGSKAVRDLSNAHDHNNRHVQASITHVRDKVAAAVAVAADEGIKAEDRSARDLSRTQHRNKPLRRRRVQVRKADLSADARAR
jgi:hypothetical protein